MDPNDLRPKVEAAIREHIEWEQWNRDAMINEAEQKSLRTVLDSGEDARPGNDMGRLGDMSEIITTTTDALCPVCAAWGREVSGEYGYKDAARTLRWYCGQHKLARYWADDRRVVPPVVEGGAR